MASEIRPLTGLRGIAALYVVGYHFLQGRPGGTPLNTLVQHGYLAVDLFFVLSGFVLATVHGRDTFDAAGYLGFLQKRFARVYPLYAAVTIATVLLAVTQGLGTFSTGRLLVNAALMQSWGIGATIVPPAWSLSAEVGAYLLFPLLCATLLSGTWRQAVLLAGAAFMLLATVALRDTVPREGPLDLYQSETVAPLIRCLCEVALGLVAFRASRTRWLARTAGVGTPAVAAATAMLLAVPGSDLAVVLLLPFLVAGFAVRQDGVVGHALASAPAMWLGKVSYSIYLLHFLLREQVRDPVAAWLAAHGWAQAYPWANAVTLLVVLAAAQLTFVLIERPARSVFRVNLRPAPSAS